MECTAHHRSGCLATRQRVAPVPGPQSDVENKQVQQSRPQDSNTGASRTGGGLVGGGGLLVERVE